MLQHLIVEQFALVERIEVGFGPGFNVLSGETGAGKTVLVEAIGALLGDRVDAMMVRSGAGSSVLEAQFDLSGNRDAVRPLIDAGLMEGGETELVLRRSIAASGRGRCSINGRTAPLSALQEAGDALLEVHGQNTHQALLRTSTHLQCLDRFAGRDHLEALDAYRARYREYRELRRERAALSDDGGRLSREADMLRHEIRQIEQADVKDGELEDLELEAVRLRNAALLGEMASSAAGALDSEGRGAREMVARAAADLRKVAEKDGSAEGMAGRAEELSLELEDLAREASSYAGRLESDPARLEAVESRMALLRELCRRYGGSLDTVLEYRDEASGRLNEIETASETLAVLDSRLAESMARLVEAADGMSARRMEAAAEMEEMVARHMDQLEMGGGRLSVRVETDGPGCEPGRDGFDEVEFLFSPVKGEFPRPLRSIASGGEISRVMLAIKMVLAGTDRLPVLVFDEVDAGIGGETALSIGEKLHALGAFHQVFCITHLPQIATFADRQYRVFKEEKDSTVRTRVEELDESARIDELCRMLGDASGRGVTREHARESLERARRRIAEAEHG